MAGDVGGFGEFMYITFIILVGGYANRMFFASVITDMFRVRLGTGKADISDLYKRSKTLEKEKLRRRQGKGAVEMPFCNPSCTTQKSPKISPSPSPSLSIKEPDQLLHNSINASYPVTP